MIHFSYNIYLPFFIIILFFLIITYFIRYYDLKKIFFWILAKIQGIKRIIYINKINMNEIKEILQSSIKGKFIEYYIATPAWYPIISLESSDHEEWKNVKNNFLIFIQNFKILGKKNLSIYIENNINILL